MEDPRSDAEMIEASLSKPAEFGRVFERHWDSVFRFLERRIGVDGAQDLASDVFRIAFKRRTTFQIVHGTSCLPWLYGIAANLVLKERRRFARHLEAVDRFSGMTMGGVEDHAASVAARLDSEQTWTRVRDMLSRMDSVSREMLLLVAWEGFSYEQVATAFDVPLGTVRSRLHRARSRLRATLNPAVGPHNEPAIREKKS